MVGDTWWDTWFFFFFSVTFSEILALIFGDQNGVWVHFGHVMTFCIGGFFFFYFLFIDPSQLSNQNIELTLLN